jgi:ribonuclease Z
MSLYHNMKEKIEFIVIGSGTFVPDKRGNSCYLLTHSNDNIIFDFGRGAIDRLLKLKIDLYSLDNIFISHFHQDHFLEIASFISFILDNPNKDKLKEKYRIYGPVGLKESINKILEAFYMNCKKHMNFIELIELKDLDIVNINNVKIIGFSVIHKEGMNSLAYRIETNKQSICYSGDSIYCEGIKRACLGSDYAIIDSTLDKNSFLTSHMNGEEVGKLANECHVKNVISTHVAARYLKHVKKDIKNNFKGNLILARDFLKIRL